MARRKAHPETKLLNCKGARLRALRLAAGLTQTELVVRLQTGGWDCDPMVLNRIELGKHTLTDFEIERILSALGCRWADLDD